MEKIDKLLHVAHCVAWMIFIYYIAKLIVTNIQIFCTERAKQKHELAMIEQNLKRQEGEQKHQKDMKNIDFTYKMDEIKLTSKD